MLEVKRDAQAGSCGSYAFFGVPAGCDGAPPVDDPPPGQETLKTDTYYSASFTRDLMGRLATMSETVLGQAREYEYVYDDADRLYQVILDGEVVEEYTYDDNGNRLSAMRDGETVFASYDDQDRMLAHGDLSFVWDGAGDLEQKIDNAANETTTYDYDAFGNLRGVTLPNGTDIEYLVDAMGRRVGKKVDGVLAKGWLYQDALNPVAELDANGDVVSMFAYVSRGHVPDLMYRDGKTYRIISDYRGSVRMVTDLETGKVMQRLEYDAWGRVLVDTNPGFVPFGYAGGLYDAETALVRFGARDYDAEVGRWTAKDPTGFRDGPSLYTYTQSDAVNSIDLRGEDTQSVGIHFEGAAGVQGSVTLGIAYDDEGGFALVFGVGGGGGADFGASASLVYGFSDFDRVTDLEGWVVNLNSQIGEFVQCSVSAPAGKNQNRQGSIGIGVGAGLPLSLGAQLEQTEIYEVPDAETVWDNVVKKVLPWYGR